MTSKRKTIIKTLTDGENTRLVEVIEQKALENKLLGAIQAAQATFKKTERPTTACAYCNRPSVPEGCFDGVEEVKRPESTEEKTGQTQAAVSKTKYGWHTCQHLQFIRDQERFTNAMDSIGLDETKFARGWNELKTDEPGWDVARRISEGLLEARAQCLNLYFYGLLGRGKTHAALLLCRDGLKLGLNTAQFQFSDFALAVRGTYAEDSETTEEALMGYATKPDLLLLDDIFEDLSDAQKRLLRAVLMRRDNAGKPTILTGNLTPKKLDEIIDQRGADRFAAKRLEVLFDGKKFRDDEVKNVSELKKRFLGE